MASSQCVVQPLCVTASGLCGDALVFFSKAHLFVRWILTSVPQNAKLRHRNKLTKPRISYVNRCTASVFHQGTCVGETITIPFCGTSGCYFFPQPQSSELF